MGPLHTLQIRLLEEAKKRRLSGKTLREIGQLVGVSEAPQAIKHHLLRLQERGLITADFLNREYNPIAVRKAGGEYVSIPIFGSANCGPPSLFADNRIEGYLKVSKRFVGNKKLFVIRAVGNSMNKANVKGQTIANGDLVLIDRQEKSVKDGDYVVFVIDECANLKKVRIDKQNQTVTLLSESTESFAPILLHVDEKVITAGKVLQVIKTN